MKTLLALAISLCLANSAYASTSGPQLAEVLGWDSKEQKAFVEIHFFDEGDERQAIYYFDLRNTDWIDPVKIRRALADSAAWVESLRARLRPLKNIPIGSESVAQVLAIDSLEATTIPRYLVRLALKLPLPPPFWSHEYAVDVVAYRDSSARALSAFEVPGHHQLLAIVSFHGLPSGYETQFPVLLASPSNRSVLGPIRRWP